VEELTYLQPEYPAVLNSENVEEVLEIENPLTAPSIYEPSKKDVDEILKFETLPLETPDQVWERPIPAKVPDLEEAVEFGIPEIEEVKYVRPELEKVNPEAIGVGQLPQVIDYAAEKTSPIDEFKPIREGVRGYSEILQFPSYPLPEEPFSILPVDHKVFFDNFKPMDFFPSFAPISSPFAQFPEIRKLEYSPFIPRRNVRKFGDGSRPIPRFPTYESEFEDQTTRGDGEFAQARNGTKSFPSN